MNIYYHVLASWSFSVFERFCWIRLEYKLQDMWIGLFWRRHGSGGDVWICLLPCLPIHISWDEIPF